MKNLLKIVLIPVLMTVTILQSIADESCNSELIGGAYVTLADKFGGEITINELRSVKALGIAGCAAGSKVYTFILEIRSDGESKKFTGDSNTLSKEIIADLRSLKKGDTFIFTSIKAHLPSGGKINAMGRTFVVVS